MKTDLERRLRRLEAPGEAVEGAVSAVVIYDPAEGPDAAIARLRGPLPATIVLLPDNGRDAEPA